MRPLVSIIIPFYNAEKFLDETIESVLKQTYENWECILVDDGSSDSSGCIARKNCQEDNRFKYFRQDNSGPSRARNSGFQLSRGKYIQFLDADDVMLPNRLEIILSAYENTNSNIILYTDLMVGENENIKLTSKYNFNTTLDRDIDFYSMYKYFPNTILFVPGCILFPRNSIENIRWDEMISHAEDWDYYLQILKNSKYKFRNIPDSLFVYRNTDYSLSKNKEKMYRANYLVIEKYRTFNSLIIYSKKCGMLCYSNILNIRKKRISKFISPIDFRRKGWLLSLLLLPISLVFGLSFFFHVKRRS